MDNRNKKQNYQSQNDSKNLENLIKQHGKLPPQAVDLEEALIGCTMLEKHVYDEVGHLITAEMFYKESHQIIFDTIETMAENANPIDILTVTEALKARGDLDVIGGPMAIVKLTDRIATTLHAVDYAHLVRQKYIQREMIKASMIVTSEAYQDFEEAVQIYQIQTEQIDDLLVGKRQIRNMKEIAKDHFQELERRTEIKKSGKLPAIASGLVDLDRITNGWHNGTLIVLGARPSMGKTACALKFAKEAARQGKHIPIFSLETTDLRLMDRLICSHGGIDPKRLRTGSLEDSEFAAYQSSVTELTQLPIYIDDSANVNVKHIRATARAMARKKQCDMIVIDYLQLVDSTTSNRSYNREQEIAQISRGLKLLAMELDIPIILLCQLSRDVEKRGGNKQPQLSDLRESGAIEQDADMVIFPYRPEYYGITEDDNGESLENVLMFLVRKNKEGELGEAYARRSSNFTQIFDMDFNESPNF
jgi:replicative DNA helicase